MAYCYDLPRDTPSAERIGEISKSKKNAEIMVSHGMDDFPDDDGWSLLLVSMNFSSFDK